MSWISSQEKDPENGRLIDIRWPDGLVAEKVTAYELKYHKHRVPLEWRYSTVDKERKKS